jgi:hypothetical protein
MKTLKLILALAAIGLSLSSCNGGYVGGGYAGPYLGFWGPYGGGDFGFGGYGYHHYFGLHHFYGHGVAVHHFAGNFHGSRGFHSAHVGGFHAGGGHR